jgi:cobalt-zinc-cadmium efflux system membrane fusion protein
MTPPMLRTLSFLALPLFILPACVPQAKAAKASASSMPPAGEARLSPEKARSAGIVVVPVTWREVDRELSASGRITFDDQRVTHVFSPVNGRVRQLVAPLGARVRKGDPLALIESPDLGSAFSDFVKARAAAAAAESEYQRQRELFAAHAAAERDLENAQSTSGQAQAELERAREKARLLNAGTGNRVSQSYTLRTPIAGEVISRAVNPGVEVQGQYGGGTAVELYTVGELDRVQVIADVFEIDVPRIRVGAPVAVEVVAFPGRRFAGRVDWISGTVDPASRTAKVRCAIANPDRALKPEMYATVLIGVPGRRALALPRGAVLRQGEQTVVFRAAGTAADGTLRFERWPVKVDEEGNDSAVAVLDGLRAGDKVVVSGGILLLGMV